MAPKKRLDRLGWLWSFTGLRRGWVGLRAGSAGRTRAKKLLTFNGLLSKIGGSGDPPGFAASGLRQRIDRARQEIGSGSPGPGRPASAGCCFANVVGMLFDRPTWLVRCLTLLI